MNGLFGALLGGEAFGSGALHGGLGSCSVPDYDLHAREQQLRMSAIMAQQQAPYRGVPFWGRGGLYCGDENNQKVKHVESHEVTCIEVATKQIAGAVKAVDDAAQAVKDVQDKV